jgi:hypothetical protein
VKKVLSAAEDPISGVPGWTGRGRTDRIQEDLERQREKALVAAAGSGELLKILGQRSVMLKEGLRARRG